MSEEKANTVTDRKRIILKGPIMLKKDNIKFIKTTKSNNKVILKQIQPVIREDVVYESEDNDFLKGESLKLILVNRLNVLTNSCRTIARYVTNSKVTVEKTSDCVVKLIGQKNYDTVFSTLLSVINQEQKIKSMLALLTAQKNTVDVACEANFSHIKEEMQSPNKNKKYSDVSCQTDEAFKEHYYREKPKRKSRRQQISPYVVKEPIKYDRVVKRIVINPEDLKDQNLIDANLEKKIEQPNGKFENEVNVENDQQVDEIPTPMAETRSIPELKIYVDEDSLISNGNPGSITYSDLSITDSVFGAINKCIAPVESHSNDHFQPCTITMPDGSEIKVPIKPEDHFHIATPEILKNVTHYERRRLMFLQAFIDWKYCLVQEDDHNLPIHRAVLNNDLDFLRRQCLVLKQMPETVDTIDVGMSALHVSIIHDSSPQCTTMLLHYGADLFLTDAEARTAFHLAAEGATRHLQAMIDFCKANARKILQDNEELWKPGFENLSDTDLSTILLREISVISDDQGYTPLMLAARQGKDENVKLLVDISPSTINAQTPNSGNTALYLGVEAACLDATSRSNKSKLSDNFKRTLEILIENGGDPNLNNFVGSNVNIILADNNIGELSMLIANKLVAAKFFPGDQRSKKNYNSLILYKDPQDKVKTKDTNDKTNLIEIEISGQPLASRKTTAIANISELNKDGLNPSKRKRSQQKKKMTDILVNIQQNEICNSSNESGSHHSIISNNTVLKHNPHKKLDTNTIIDKPANIIIRAKQSHSNPKSEGGPSYKPIVTNLPNNYEIKNASKISFVSQNIITAFDGDKIENNTTKRKKL